MLRELGFGVRRFKDILINTGAPRETVSLRLRKHEDYGLIEHARRGPPHFLTALGRLGGVRLTGRTPPVTRGARLAFRRLQHVAAGGYGHQAGKPE